MTGLNRNPDYSTIFIYKIKSIDLTHTYVGHTIDYREMKKKYKMYIRYK